MGDLQPRDPGTKALADGAFYRADHPMGIFRDVANDLKWRPSIHMPRWASRITLVVTNVKVERVQDTSSTDARLEGHPRLSVDPNYSQEAHDDAAHDWFMDLWDSLNAKRGFGWSVNPWVVAITFVVFRGNIDTLRSQEISNG